MIRFFHAATRRIKTNMGLTFWFDYEGKPTRDRADALDKKVIPLILAAPTMAETLRQIADDDYKGAHTFLDEDHHAIMTIERIKELARRALPRRRKRPPMPKNRGD